jgi:hypothetical protein
MNTEELDKELSVLWEESHSKSSENPTDAFIKYCKIVLDAYTSHVLDSQAAGYKLCGEFNPEVSFKQTKESEEIKNLACDLELPTTVQSGGKTIEEKWQRIQELLEIYGN